MRKKKTMAAEEATTALGAPPMQTGAASHVGAVRATNGDALLTLELSLQSESEPNFIGLCAVADGLGGKEGGEVASYLALRALSHHVVRKLVEPSLSGRRTQAVATVLVEGARRADRLVQREQRRRRNDMATTLVAALIHRQKAYVVNVGDSRAYHIGPQEIRRVTVDHSLVEAMVAEGVITEQEVYTHPMRNVVTRTIGSEGHVVIDTFEEMIAPGESLLLCSDGLWEMVSKPVIGRVIREATVPQAACDELIRQALREGGEDNVSVIIVKNMALPETAASAPGAAVP